MSNAGKPEPPTPSNDQESASSGDHELPFSEYEVVPGAEKADPADLYAFRAALEPPAPPPPSGPKSAVSGLRVKLLTVAIGLGCAALAAMVILALTKPKPPPPYIDLGAARFDAAGLKGRLVAQWEGSAAYELYLDPFDQDGIPGFEAVAQDPPRQLTLTVRLLDSSGGVACEKLILLPAPAPPGAAPDPAQALAPQITPTGDTAVNVAGDDGKIDEIDLTGGLPCSEKAYRRLAGWDFSTNFPTVQEQQDWIKHEDELAESRKRHRTRRFAQPFRRLPAPIEGDDVIVGDNPSSRTLSTSGGLVFLVRPGAARNGSAEWQIFPAPIHYRCDKKGFCILTRIRSGTVLPARLLK